MLRASLCTRMVLVASILSLSGCFSDGGENSGNGNNAPVIAGAAPRLARIDEQYLFRPLASDADGDRLTFSGTSLPAWATLNAATGELSGTPTAGEEGEYEAIRISVSDGQANTTLGPFTITVNQDAPGSVSLSWLPPAENADGTPLIDLMGYRIEYGRNRNDLDQSIAIANSSVSTYLVERLSSGTWYFSVVAINTRGIESAPSSIATKNIG